MFAKVLELKIKRIILQYMLSEQFEINEILILKNIDRFLMQHFLETLISFANFSFDFFQVQNMNEVLWKKIN